MNKTEMISRLAQKTGSSKTHAQKALQSILDTVAGELKHGGKVTLNGFGTFSVTERKPRTGRHPRTGEVL
ncbi:MAG: HU family DNA-binding protein, partial [Desulfonatronovibrio sp.]